MQVLAHRGFSGVYPENTMLAFEKAVEAGADGVELDIHLSSDGKIVVIHDESLLRTAGIDKLVEECTLKELTSTVASKTQGDRFETRIPSFEEFCDFVSKNDIKANVELKTGITWYRDIEKKSVEMIKSFGIEEKILFSSFNWLSITKLKELIPEIPGGLLYEKMLSIKYLPYLAETLGYEYLHPDYKLVNEQLVKECKDSGREINAWTVNTEDGVRRLMSLGIHGVISNYPDMCLRVLGR